MASTSYSAKGKPSIRAQWAQRLVREKLAAELRLVGRASGGGQLLKGGLRSPDGGEALPIDEPELWTPKKLPTETKYSQHKQGRSDLVGADPLIAHKVCIVGAGVSGLYIAMILDDLRARGVIDVAYEILEAHEWRVGGRLFTYPFPGDADFLEYYDIGAMRYPELDSMARTFDLFRRAQIEDRLIPYHLSGNNTPSLFNDRFFADGADPYHVSVANGGLVPNDVVDDVSGALEIAFGPYKAALTADFDTGFDYLMTADDYSTREFLKRGGPEGTQPKRDFFAVGWMETQNTSTGLFDQAFSESVIDSFDFNDEVPWKCILGGSTILANAMVAKLADQTKLEIGKRVDAITFNRDLAVLGNMSVKCAGEAEPRTGYTTVFNTTTLGCLGRMDLRTLELHPTQKDAIRCLNYDRSVKVGIKFKTPWWIYECGINQGGSASTDIPLRTCVYPSYNLEVPDGQPAVLLASYTWAQDATRMGSLVSRNSPEGEEELIELMLQDLARLHAQHGITYEKLRGYYMTHHAYSWSHDPTMSGAFALFGPGQFSNYYPYLVRPAADGKFHIVGEAASAHHAWVVGALDSAYLAVYQFLYRYEMWDALDALQEFWGELDELETGEHGTAHLQVMLGSLPEDYKFKV